MVYGYLRRLGWIAFLFLVELSSISGLAQDWQRVINLNGKAGSAIGGGSGNTLYAGLVSGDVYRSADNGLTWTAATNGLVDNSGRMLLPKGFAVGANGRIIRGGDNASWGNGVGSPIFYSDNQGANWIQAPLPFGSPTPNPGGIGISDLVSHKGALYFSDLLSAGIWKSADNGQTWVSVGNSLPAVPYTATKTYYAVASAGDALLTVEPFRGVFRSIDGGASWSQAVNGMAGVLNSPLVGGTTWSGTDVTGAPDGTAFAAVDNNLYRSRDGGATWTQTGAGLFLARKVEMLGDRVFVAAADSRFFEGASLGESWSELPQIPGGSGSANILSQSFATYNGALYFAGTNGIYRLDLASATRKPIAPLVTINPPGAYFVNIGSPLSVTAKAAGTAPFTYEWRLKGNVIGTEAALAFSPSATNQAGDLVLVVSNAGGATTNTAGKLTIADSAPGQPDYSFRPQLLAALSSITINAFAFDADGSVFYGGQNLFSFAGDTYRGLRRAFGNGVVDARFVTGTVGGNGTGPATVPVRTLLPLRDGSVLVGASDTSTDARFWRRMLADGSLDASWPWPAEMAGGPWKAIRLANGKFMVASGSSGGLNRLNADGTYDSTFIPPASIGRFQQQYVRALALQADGRVLIGGNFNTIDNNQRHALARLSPDGAIDLAYAPADIVNNRGEAIVAALLVLPSGKLLIAGSFTMVGGQARTGIARLNPDGSLDSSFPNLNLNNSVYALAPQPDGKIWLGGAFTGASGRSYLLRISPDGVIDSTFPDVGLNDNVQALEFTADGRLWIGSASTVIGSLPGGQLLKIFTDVSGPALGFPGFDQKPNQGDSIVLTGTVSGAFTGVQWRFNSAPLPGATSLSLPLKAVTTANSGAYDLVITSVGGISTSAPVNIRVRGSVVIDQQPQSAIGLVSNNVTFATVAFGRAPITYQWLRDGAPIANATNRTLTLTNLALTQQADYSVRVTGGDASTAVSDPAFLTVVPAPGIRDRAFNASLFSMGFNTLSRVSDFALLPDGRILVAGEFATVNGGSLQRLARLKADGSIDSTLAFDSSPYTEINRIALEGAGTFLLLVRLNQGGGPYEVHRFTADGKPDSSFIWPANQNIYPNSMQLGPDGSVYIATSFGVSRLTTAGAIDAAFGNNAKTTGAVSDLTLDPSGRIYIVGSFTAVSNVPRTYFARLLPDGTLDQAFVPPTLLGLPGRLFPLPDGVLASTVSGLFRLKDNGDRDFTFLFNGAPSVFDQMADGGIAAVLSAATGQGVLSDANGRPARPASTFTVPLSFTGGYTRLRVATDGSFYLSQQTIESSNLLFHVSGTVVPLAMVTQPASQMVNSGASVSFTATAIGTSVVRYQWQRNGVDLPGETNATLNLSKATPAANADYQVIASNRSSSLTSRAATLVVLAGPEILSQSTDLSVGVGNSFVLSVQARGVAPLTYQWRRGGQPIPGATFSTFTNNAAALADAGAYDLMVSNALAFAASAPIQVSVVVIPGSVIQSFAPTAASGVSELALLPDGRIIAGSFSGGARAYNVQGAVDNSFPVMGANNTDFREKIAIDSSARRIYVSPSSTLRAFDFNGVGVPGFAAPNTSVRIVRAEAAGTLLISDNGITPSLQRLETNGILKAGFTPATRPVTDFWPLPDGRILVLSSQQRLAGGNYAFDTLVQRWNADGSLDPAFNSSTQTFNLGQQAARIAADSKGRILVLGGFQTFLGQTRTSVARLNADGTIDSSFTPPTINGAINDVAEQTNGRLVIVGEFTQVNGLPRSLVARLNDDGSNDATFTPGAGLTRLGGQNTAFAVKILSEGQIIVGGTFDHADGVARPGLVMLTGDVPGANPSDDPFAAWTQTAGLSGANAQPDADPDGDGRNNLTEFILGTSPTDKSSAPAFPVGEHLVGNNHHPAVTIIRRSSPGSAQLQIKASSNLNFSDYLGVTTVSITPLADGLERVVIRSNKPATEAPRQFFRFTIAK